MKIVTSSIAALLLCACTGDISGVDRPASLAGTTTDGDLPVDEAGQFVADADAVQLFDYFLTTEGELDDAALYELVSREADERLPERAAAQARDAFRRYVEYRAGVAAILSDSGLSPREAEQRADRLHATLVSDMPGLADEPARLERALALRAIISDPGLDPPARRAAIARVEAAMRSPSEAAVEADARAASRVMLDLRAALAGVTDDDAIRSIRIAWVGVDAAERLHRLDVARADWRRRLHEYHRARAALRAETAPSAERDSALERLLASRFGVAERRRVRALERIAESRTE